MVNHGKSYANNMANGGKQMISGLFDDRRVPSPWGTRLSTSRRPDFAPICGQRPMCHGQRLEILEISQILQKPCQLGSRLCWHRYPLRRASKEAPSFFGIWVNPKSHRYMWYSMIYLCKLAWCEIVTTSNKLRRLYHIPIKPSISIIDGYCTYLSVGDTKKCAICPWHPLFTTRAATSADFSLITKSSRRRSSHVW